MAKNPSATVDMTNMEFLAGYDPEITYWGLTETGRARVEAGVFPSGIGVRGPGILRLLYRIGNAEEDEIGGFFNLTPAGSKRQMKRLAGFGLVGQPS